MQFIRNSDNPNAVAGVFLLILLAVFAGPNTLPQVVSVLIPSAAEGIPCEWLRAASERAQHQSLIGRQAQDPLELRVRASPLPSTADGRLTITITIINRTIGTVPILFNAAQIRVGDDNTSGMGIVFTPPNALTTPTLRPNAPTFSERDIRLLGPRQRCTVTLEFTVDQLRLVPDIGSGTVTVTAFYRMNTSGAIVGAAGTPIFSDQGLRPMLIFSPAVPVDLPAAVPAQ